MQRPRVVFLVNLLQDVNILRPLALLAASELDIPVEFLMSDKFIERDSQGLWQAEIEGLCQQIGALSRIYDSEFAAHALLQGKRGVLVAASESNLSAHTHTHNVFRVAPPQFLKVTLQHGYECVGFLQNREHDKAHGRGVMFAADVICGWCDPAAMRSIAPSERSKYYLTGPSALLQQPPRAAPTGRGMVCENLHSVRLRMSGGFEATFMETFSDFCAELERRGQQVTLRPHPGGQYVLKNNIEIPPNVDLDNAPMYRVDLSSFTYGISAPSSVLIDMVLAGLPTAVWQDEDGIMDASNYEGLTSISGLDDWLAFERDAALRPSMLLERQARFLARSRLQVDRRLAHERFARLLSGGFAAGAPRRPRAVERVLLVANDLIPTLQISFIKPFAPDVEAGRVDWDLIAGEDLKRRYADGSGQIPEGRLAAARAWLAERIAAFSPTIVVFCRYSDPMAEVIVREARGLGVPVVLHIDDDLLNVPREIGAAKYRAHNRPERLATVRYLLSDVDLVYCSTVALQKRLSALGADAPLTAGSVYCTHDVLRPASEGPVRTIGYMGFDHGHDLELVVPALVHVLRARPEVRFELFGSIPKPAALDEFGGRVAVMPPIRQYADFMARLAELEWDIGLCPLAATRFNSLKADTKWVEYTAVGAAVVATRGMAYDECCADGCGRLVQHPDEWIEALDALCDDPSLRHRIAAAAQERLRRDYPVSRLRRQIAMVFGQARQLCEGK
jgi:glycosyltransferase involved in cell wall biosynthesis